MQFSFFRNTHRASSSNRRSMGRVFFLLYLKRLYNFAQGIHAAPGFVTPEFYDGLRSTKLPSFTSPFFREPLISLHGNIPSITERYPRRTSYIATSRHSNRLYIHVHYIVYIIGGQNIKYKNTDFLKKERDLFEALYIFNQKCNAKINNGRFSQNCAIYDKILSFRRLDNILEDKSRS